MGVGRVSKAPHRQGLCVWLAVFSRIRPEELGIAQLAKCFLGERGTPSLVLHGQIKSQALPYTCSPQLGKHGQMNLCGSGVSLAELRIDSVSEREMDGS